MPAWFLGGSGWQGALCWAGEGVFGHCVCKSGSMAVSRRHLTPLGASPVQFPPKRCSLPPPGTARGENVLRG